MSEAMTDRLEELQAAAEEVADTAIAAMRQVGTLTNALARMAGTNPDELTSDLTTRLLADSQSLINQAGTGLSRIEVDMDDAALAAVAARLDLMNARGELGDDWRGIKLAGDDLKSILNLQARQRLRTENDSNRLTEFDFDESRAIQ